MVEDVYQTFRRRVSEGRGLTAEATHAVSKGRVWTGAHYSLGPNAASCSVGAWPDAQSRLSASSTTINLYAKPSSIPQPKVLSVQGGRCMPAQGPALMVQRQYLFCEQVRRLCSKGWLTEIHFDPSQNYNRI